MSAPATDLGRATADLIDAFNVADWDRMRGHLADDVAYAETGTGEGTSTEPMPTSTCATGGGRRSPT